MIKYKNWVANVTRVRGDLKTRHGKIRLDKNERVSDFPLDFLDDIRNNITSDLISSYPETEKLYNLLSDELKVNVEQIVVTAGSDAAIRTVFDLFVNPNDEVIILYPTFAMIEIYCRLYNAKTITIGYNSNLELEHERLLQSINEKTALIIIPNPNSPTGTLICDDVLKLILNMASRYNVPVFIDEAYYGFNSTSAIDHLSEYDNLIIGRTFSKSFGLAGLRVGYLIASRTLAQLLYCYRPMYEVNSIGVQIAVLALQRKDIMENYVKQVEMGRAYLIGCLKERKMRFADTKTNFIHIDFLNNRFKALELFERKGVLIRGGLPIAEYGSYLRVTLGPIDEMKKVVEVIDLINI
jgi:histidinol-phosphate aminotransferase